MHSSGKNKGSLKANNRQHGAYTTCAIRPAGWLCSGWPVSHSHALAERRPVLHEPRAAHHLQPGVEDRVEVLGARAVVRHLRSATLRLISHRGRPKSTERLQQWDIRCGIGCQEGLGRSTLPRQFPSGLGPIRSHLCFPSLSLFLPFPFRVPFPCEMQGDTTPTVFPRKHRQHFGPLRH